MLESSDEAGAKYRQAAILLFRRGHSGRPDKWRVKDYFGASNHRPVLEDRIEREVGRARARAVIRLYEDDSAACSGPQQYRPTVGYWQACYVGDRGCAGG